jgi:hypothetical protein
MVVIVLMLGDGDDQTMITAGNDSPVQLSSPVKARFKAALAGS